MRRFYLLTDVSLLYTLPGYTGLFVQRTGGRPDGCAIFFQNAKFALVNYKLVEYNTPKVSVLDKDNVGVVLLLRANTSSTEDSLLCIANTHLLFNKKRGDIKLAQLAYLFAEINDLAVLSKNGQTKTSCPVILCGDLNSMPYSPLYHFLISGQLEYSTRSPAVISGQLGSSEARSGPSSKRIRTPLLPWEFGVTAGCQWRERRGEKLEDSRACVKERQTSFQHREGSHVQNSGRDTTSGHNSRLDLTSWVDRDVNTHRDCSYVSGSRSDVKSDPRSGRQSKESLEIIDLTGDPGKPSVHEVTIDGRVKEDSEQNIKSNQTKGPNQTTNYIQKSKSDIFDLRANTDSPRHKRA